MLQTKYAKITKKKMLQALAAYNLLSYSKQDWQIVVKEFNSLSLQQRTQIIKEEKLREELLKRKITTTDEDMYLTCTMVNLNIVASKFDIDPATVCMCIAPLCKITENILVV